MVAEGRQRIDKWLFFTRAVKSRSLAAKLVQGSKVRVNRDKVDQPSYPLKSGDVLTISLERRVLVWRVVGLGVRRGPSEEARTLYEDMTPVEEKSDPATRVTPPALREPGSGRPTKRERRQIDALRDDV